VEALLHFEHSTAGLCWPNWRQREVLRPLWLWAAREKDRLDAIALM
jgi:hypothetical protein